MLVLRTVRLTFLPGMSQKTVARKDSFHILSMLSACIPSISPSYILHVVILHSTEKEKDKKKEEDTAYAEEDVTRKIGDRTIYTWHPKP